MEELRNTQQTKLAPNTELDTAMPNALMTLNSFGDKLTAKIGMMTKVTMDHVVLNSMSGKPTNTPMPTPPIPADNLDTLDVKELNVEMDPKDKMESVIRMDATLTHSEMVILISMDLDPILPSIPLDPSPSSLNSSLTMELIMEICLKSEDSMCKEERKSKLPKPMSPDLAIMTALPMLTARNKRLYSSNPRHSEAEEDLKPWEKLCEVVWSLY